MSDNSVFNHNKSRNLLLLMISDREDREGKVLPKGGYEERTQRKSKRRKYNTFATFKRYWISPEETIEIIKTHRNIEENEFIEETILPSKCVLQTNATNKKVANVI